MISSIIISDVSWRKNERPLFSIMREDDLTLRARDSDDNQGFSFLQILDFEIKESKPFPIEFFIQLILFAAGFNFLLQVMKVLDGYDASLPAVLREAKK